MDFTVSLSEARRLLGRPLLFAANDESRPVLTGVLVEAEACGKVIATAADGFRLGTQVIKHAAVAGAGVAILPAATVQQAMKTWPKKGDGHVRIHSNEAGTFSIAASISTPGYGAHGIEIHGDVIQGTFPDYRKLFEADSRDGGEYVTLDPHEPVTCEGCLSHDGGPLVDVAERILAHDREAVTA